MAFIQGFGEQNYVNETEISVSKWMLVHGREEMENLYMNTIECLFKSPYLNDVTSTILFLKYSNDVLSRKHNALCYLPVCY